MSTPSPYWFLGTRTGANGTQISIGFVQDSEPMVYELNLKKGNVTYRTILHPERDGIDTEEKAKALINGWVSHFSNLVNAR